MEIGRVRPARYRLAPLMFWLGLGIIGTEFCQAAGISLNKTRVIFTQGERAQTLTVVNTTPQAWLVQVRLTEDQEKTTSAFVVTPPLFRLEANSQNSLRILPTFNQPPFPVDRESLGYIQMNAIPATQRMMDEPVREQASMSVGMRIKFFWRPHGLPMLPEEAYGQLRFQSQPDGIKACNPTPYFLSLDSLSLDGQTLDLNRYPSMIAPQDCVTYAGQEGKSSVSWSMINDYGGASNLFTGRVAR
ncbi:fimbrial biogenesis chaperone [Photorhabdus luminescens]|uniref:Molecular chaperone n=1 Tax=Photorhabdus luminescens subsp. sonorensis TaxID=1173677 RepID=A0A5C4RK34_PHOLU|nr:molecular chaperone [Photorhabdus luminescens]TNH44174.1 molecular chaperone [Photorhabdus luminescens subsp. sonorensis]